MNSISYGYKTIDESKIDIQSFFANSADLTPEFQKNGDVASISTTWVPHDSTRIEVAFLVNLEDIRNCLGLSEQDSINYLLRSYSNGTKRQFVSQIFLLMDRENTADLQIPKFQASGALDVYLEFFVILKEGSSRLLGAPRKSFSNVHRRKWKISLSGDGTQANVYLSEFAKHEDAKNSLYKIHLSPPDDFEDWPLAQQSSVVKIEINNDVPPEMLRSKEFITLLMSDLIWLSIDKFMLQEGGVEMLRSPNMDSGSWLDFAKWYFALIFPPGNFLVDSEWISKKPEIKSRIQSLVAPTLEQNLAKLLKAFEEKNG